MTTPRAPLSTPKAVSGAGRGPRAAAVAALVLVPAGLVMAGCGSSGDGTATSTGQRAAASGATKACAGSGKPAASPFRMTMRNDLGVQVAWAFSGVDCTGWVGQAPGTAPVTLAAGESVTLALDPNCSNSPKVFTATLSSSGRVQRTVRLGVRNGNCRSDPTVFSISAQDPAKPSSSAPWVMGSPVRVPTGGRSWQITAGTGGEGRGTLAVGLLP